MVVFSKQLKATDVGSNFSWPARKLHLLHPFVAGDHRHAYFEAVDSTGKVWPLTCSVRQRGRYLKPVLTDSSWLPFVKERLLAVGDIVVFYRDVHVHTPIRFRVRVRKLKTIKLFGRYITAHAAED